MTSENAAVAMPGRPWDAAAETARDMAFGLLGTGLLALVAWPLGWLPDGFGPVSVGAVAAAGGRRLGDLYRKRPPGRRSAVAAALLVMSASAVAGSAATSWISPSAEDLGFTLGALAGLPLGAAAFVGRINHRGRAVSRPPDPDAAPCAGQSPCR
ncbi:hypothetical protein ACH5AL_07140 [Actinacidiphila glaucinigra]|uniref:hypothetical protein n=1 Tax=Actinacidiphila glaucinigra TaxID=235986 RepID=UPI0037BCCE28